jgi:tetratricopeptide (TPR) repeat protein
MPDTSAAHGKTFDENIEILFEELVLATKWGRPSVLLAIHKSRFGQDKAEDALEARLKAIGQSVARIVVNDQRSDVARQILGGPAASQAVFFVSNLDWGGGEGGKQAYRALNMQREHFVEQGIKAVFWLTTAEAAHLPRYAPDFWAFRHRVIEFVSQRAPSKVRLPAGALAWDIQKSVDPFESLQEGIRAREELLSRLPRNEEALSTRVELHRSLGYLHWASGDSHGAADAFGAGLKLAGDHELPELKAGILNGLGIVEYEAGKYPEALETFKEGLRYQVSNRSLLINFSATCCVLGRNQEALTFAKRAIRSNPADAESWGRVGYLYGAMGKPDEAIASLNKAAELAPRVPAHHAGLAVFYGLIDRPDEARRELEAARELASGPERASLDILQAAILGEPEKAQQLLDAAIAAGTLRRYEVRRDPNLTILFDAAQIEALLG